MQVGSVYHTGFTVSDIERSVAFYRDVLGLRLVRRQTGTAPYLAAVTGFDGVRLEIALLQPADGGSMLELLQYVSHPAPPTDRATNRPGNGHLCFKVDDLRAACAELRRAGRDAGLGADGDHRGLPRRRLGRVSPRSGRLHGRALPGAAREPRGRGRLGAAGGSCGPA